MATLLITKQPGDFWSFIVNGDAASEILNTRNDLLTIGDKCHFKTANGANLIQKQDILPTDITLVSGGTFTFATKTELFDKLIDEGFFDWITGTGGGGGADRFDELEDTFSYTGNNGMTVIVNDTLQRLEPVEYRLTKNFTDLDDTPVNIVANKMVATNAAGTALEYRDIPEVDEPLLSTVGYFVYEDLPSSSTSLGAGDDVLITNNALGLETDYSQAPYGVSNVWVSPDNQINLSGLSIGDTLDLRLKLDFLTFADGTDFTVKMKIAIGSAYERTRIIHSGYLPELGTHSREFYYGFEVKNQDEIDFPTELYINVTNSAGELLGNEMYFRVIKSDVNVVTIEDDTHFKGKFPTLLALNTAFPTANDGDYALVDSGGINALMYIWDSSDTTWIQIGGEVAEKTSDLVNDGEDGVNQFLDRISAVPLIMNGFAGVTPGFAVGQLTYTLPAGRKAVDVYVAHGKQYKTTPENGALTTRWSQSGDVVTITKSPALNNYIYIEYL